MTFYDFLKRFLLRMNWTFAIFSSSSSSSSSSSFLMADPSPSIMFSRRIFLVNNDGILLEFLLSFSKNWTLIFLLFFSIFSSFLLFFSSSSSCSFFNGGSFTFSRRIFLVRNGGILLEFLLQLFQELDFFLLFFFFFNGGSITFSHDLSKFILKVFLFLMANLDLSDKDLLQLKNCQVGKDLQMAKDFNSSVHGFLRLWSTGTKDFLMAPS